MKYRLILLLVIILSFGLTFSACAEPTDAELSDTEKELNIIALYQETKDYEQLEKLIKEYYPDDIEKQNYWLAEMYTSINTKGMGWGRDNTNEYDLVDVEEEMKIEPEIGMTTEEILEYSWGEPIKKNITETRSAKNEVWIYDSENFIEFEDGIVISIQKSE